MAMVINSNIMSLNAQRNLMISSGDQNQAMERLSSGKRINSAADDAAGLAISNRMTSQVRGLDQAIRNANDGISLIQTAEGALDETTNILQRMRELSIQSANGTYDEGNRSTLNAEVQQLIAEIDRISETTKFNGLNILDGTLGKVDLQAGADAYETISLEIGATSTDSLGSAASADVVGYTTSNAGGTDAGSFAGSVTINGQTLTSTALNAATNMDEFLGVINDGVAGVEASSFVEATATAVGTGILATGTTFQVQVTFNDDTTATWQVSETASLEELADKITSTTNGAVEASINDEGRLVLFAQDATLITTVDGSTSDGASGITDGAFANSIQLTDTLGDKAITIDYASTGASLTADSQLLGLDERLTAGDVVGTTTMVGSTDFNDGDVTINGVNLGAYDASNDYDGALSGAASSDANLVNFINLKSGETGVVASVATTDGIDQLTLNSVDGSEISVDYRESVASTMEGLLGIQQTNVAAGFGNSVADIDISTAAGAQEAIEVIDTALEQINSTRGDLGAISNRLDFTINNLSNVSENVAAARSRIEDADFASESAALSRAQVLQQAGTAMLAQANAAPQQVLSLLQ
jgi:flagellin